MMKKLLILIFIFFSANADIKVLKSNKCLFTKISKDDLRHLFLGIKTNYGNQFIKIVYNTNEKDQEIFSKEYLDKTTTQMNMYWTKMIYTGKRRPPEQSDFTKINKYSENKDCILFFDSNEKIQKGWTELEII